MISLPWGIWPENARIFQDKGIEFVDLFEKTKFFDIDKAFMDFSFSLIVLNVKDIGGVNCHVLLSDLFFFFFYFSVFLVFEDFMSSFICTWYHYHWKEVFF